MDALTDQQLARFAQVAITLGVALIVVGLIALMAPWYVAVLSLLLATRPRRQQHLEREGERVRGLYRRAR